MRKLVTSTHILCWIVVAGFVAASATYGYYAPGLVRDSWCANMIVDPLSFLLNYPAPPAGCAVVALGALYYRGALRVWSPVSAGTVSALTLVALLIYGVWLFQTHLGGRSLSEIVWWMRPIGILSGA